MGTRRAVAAIDAAYDPDGINMGANLGRAAGAGIPAHLHLHVLPRWSGDTNFMTAVAGVRVMPESLAGGLGTACTRPGPRPEPDCGASVQLPLALALTIRSARLAGMTS